MIDSACCIRLSLLRTMAPRDSAKVVAGSILRRERAGVSFGHLTYRMALLCQLALAGLIGLTAAATAAGGDDDFYRGKQIRLIVSTDAGGAYDTYARLLAQVLRDHIPGNPTIIVQNMPGASGLKTANYIYSAAPRDGTVIAGTHSSVPTGPLTSPAAAVYDVNTLSWIGSVTSDPFIGYVWHTAPIQTLEDTRTTEVIMGGSALAPPASISRSWPRRCSASSSRSLPATRLRTM
jgi:hypothetical protein